MRRQLISYDAFDQIEKSSLSSASHELVEVEPILGDVLNLESIEMRCFDGNNVYYEASDGNFIRAAYRLSENAIDFDHIEEIVVDEKSANQARRAIVSDMLEAVFEKETGKASDLFRNYLEVSIPRLRRKSECSKNNKTAMQRRRSNTTSNLLANESRVEIDIPSGRPDPERQRRGRKGARSGSRVKAARERKEGGRAEEDRKHDTGEWKREKSKLDILKKSNPKYKNARLKGQRYDKDKKNEWLYVANNVLEYIDHVTSGPTIAEVSVRRDDLDNVVGARIPVTKVRNEGKLLALKWDTLKTDVKVLREKAMRLAEDVTFQQLVATLKRSNNLSDNDQLEDTMNSLVGTFPSVLYLTQGELANVIKEALSNNGATNYDDEVCDFMSEGILRVAFDSYPERINRLANLAGAPPIHEDEDAYLVLQDALYDFFPQVDEQMAVEMQVFEDLYDTFADVRAEALEVQDDLTRKQASNYLAQIEEVINGSVRPNISLAEEAGEYLASLTETNLESRPWNIVKRPYRTSHGEHPDMQKKAQHPYAPSKDFEGNWGGKLPVSDGKSYHGGGEEEMRNKSWGNVGGNDTYPSLDNPYILKSGDWTMKGEKGIDKTTDSATGQWGSSDTWPNLNNPYVPKSVKKFVNDPNRVDDVESRVGLSQTSDLHQRIS